MSCASRHVEPFFHWNEQKKVKINSAHAPDLPVIKSRWLWRNFFHPEKREGRRKTDERFGEIHYIFLPAASNTHSQQAWESSKKDGIIVFTLCHRFCTLQRVSQKASIISHSAPSEVLLSWNRTMCFFLIHFLFSLSRSAATFCLGMSYRFLSGATECEKKQRVRKKQNTKMGSMPFGKDELWAIKAHVVQSTAVYRLCSMSLMWIPFESFSFLLP